MEFLEIIEVFHRWNHQLFAGSIECCFLDGDALHGFFPAGDYFYCRAQADIWGCGTGVGVQHVCDYFSWGLAAFLPRGHGAVYWQDICGDKKETALYCERMQR